MPPRPQSDNDVGTTLAAIGTTTTTPSTIPTELESFLNN